MVAKSVIDIANIEALESLLETEKLMVVLFYDSDFLTNFAVEPEFDQFAQQIEAYTFAKVDINAIPEAANLTGYDSGSTVNFYKRGVLSSSVRGFNLNTVRGTLHKALPAFSNTSAPVQSIS